MPKLIILDHTGHDDKTAWEKGDVVSVKAAKDRFAEMLGNGHVAYKVDKDGTKTQTRSFEEDATEIILHPQMVGG